MFRDEKISSGCFFGTPIFADSLFCDLTFEARQSLARIKKTRRFQKRGVIFVAGSMPLCVYVLREGQARLSTSLGLKDRQVVRSVKPKEIFGLTEAISGLPYNMRAEAVTPCQVEIIGCAEFVRFLREESDVCFRLLRMLGSNFQQSCRLF